VFENVLGKPNVSKGCILVELPMMTLSFGPTVSYKEKRFITETLVSNIVKLLSTSLMKLDYLCLHMF